MSAAIAAEVNLIDFFMMLYSFEISLYWQLFYCLSP